MDLSCNTLYWCFVMRHAFENTDYMKSAAASKKPIVWDNIIRGVPLFLEDTNPVKTQFSSRVAFARCYFHVWLLRGISILEQNYKMLDSHGCIHPSNKILSPFLTWNFSVMCNICLCLWFKLCLTVLHITNSCMYESIYVCICLSASCGKKV